MEQTLESLKAQVYDKLVESQALQNRLQTVNKEIEKLNQEITTFKQKDVTLAD